MQTTPSCYHTCRRGEREREREREREIEGARGRERESVCLHNSKNNTVHTLMYQTLSTHFWVIVCATRETPDFSKGQQFESNHRLIKCIRRTLSQQPKTSSPAENNEASRVVANITDIYVLLISISKAELTILSQTIFFTLSYLSEWCIII